MRTVCKQNNNHKGEEGARGKGKDTFTFLTVKIFSKSYNS
jgi:hypothetical protein